MFLIAGLGKSGQEIRKNKDIILDLIPSMHWQKNTTSASRRKT